MNSVISITSNSFPSSAFSPSLIATYSSTCPCFSVPLRDVLGIDIPSPRYLQSRFFAAMFFVLFCFVLKNLRLALARKELLMFCCSISFFLFVCLTVGSDDYKLPQSIWSSHSSLQLYMSLCSCSSSNHFLNVLLPGLPFSSSSSVGWSEGRRVYYRSVSLLQTWPLCPHELSLQTIQLSADKQSKRLTFSPLAFWPFFFLDHFWQHFHLAIDR